MHKHKIMILGTTLLGGLAVGPAQSACPAIPLAQATSGYGSNGSYSRGYVSFTNPQNLLQKVYVYYPSGGTPAPTVFFSHAYGARDVGVYAGTIAHLNSRGYAVVFAQYPTLGAATGKYDVLWRGFKEAASRYPNLVDTRRVAFFGHSFGGGATPRMMLNGIQNGWGSSGKAMFIMAPWYSLNLSDSDLAAFDATVKMNVMVYDDDLTNDHEMAIDIFHNIAIPYTDKAFFKVFSDTESSCTLIADHALPMELNNGELDGLDWWNWYHMDALLDYAFTDNVAAQDIALGGGSAVQTYWGTWWTGSAYTPAQVVLDPLPSDPSSAYEFSCESADNPRADACNTRY